MRKPLVSRRESILSLVKQKMAFLDDFLAGNLSRAPRIFNQSVLGILFLFLGLSLGPSQLNAQCTGSLTVSIGGSATGSPLQILQIGADALPSACGASDGAITINIAGGSADYIYSISTSAADPCGTTFFTSAATSATSFTFTNLPEGDYYFCVTDANNCQAATPNPLTLSDPDLNTFATVVQNATCGEVNGTATVIPATGGSFTYLWDVSAASQSSATAVNLSAGLYTVTITLSPSCFLVQTVEVSETGGPDVTVNSVTNATCPVDDGVINLNVSGGVGPYTYNWSGTGTGTNPRTGLAPGNYFVTVTDNNGCATIVSEQIEQTSNLNIFISSQTDATCLMNDGAISLTCSAPTCNFNWSTGATGSTLSGLAAGAYSATATDGSGCEAVLQFTINSSTSSANLIATVQQNVSCPGGTDGIINASVAGGSTVVVITNLSGTTIFPANSLPAGDYLVIGYDASGCVVGSQELTITQPDILDIIINSIPVACDGSAASEVNFNISGGTAAYNIDWGTAPGTGINPRADVPEGNYDVTVTDGNGCVAVANVVMGPPDCGECNFDQEFVCLSVNPLSTTNICVTDYLTDTDCAGFIVSFIPAPSLGLVGSQSTVGALNPTGPGCYDYIAPNIFTFDFTTFPPPIPEPDRTDTLVFQACSPLDPTICDTITIFPFVNDTPFIVNPFVINATSGNSEYTLTINPGSTDTVCIDVLHIDYPCAGPLVDTAVVPAISGPLLPGASFTVISDVDAGACTTCDTPPFSGGDNSCFVYTAPDLPGGRDSLYIQDCDGLGLCDTVLLIVEISAFPDIIDLVGSDSYDNDTTYVSVDPNTNTTNCMVFDPAYDGEVITIFDQPDLPGAVATLVNGDLCISYDAPGLPGQMDTLELDACNNSNLFLCDTLTVIYTINCPIDANDNLVTDATQCNQDGSVCFQSVTLADFTAWNGVITVDGSTFTGTITPCNGGAGMLINLPPGPHAIDLTYGVGCSSSTNIVIGAPTPPVVQAATSTNPTACGIADGTITIEMNITGNYSVLVDGSPIGGTVSVVGTTITVSNLAAGSYGAVSMVVLDLTTNCSTNVFGTPYILSEPNAPVISDVTLVPITTCVPANYDGELQITLDGANLGTPPYVWTLDGSTITPTSTSTSTFELTGLGPVVYNGVTLMVVDNNGCTSMFSVTGELMDPPLPEISSTVINNTLCGQANGSIDIDMVGNNANYTYTWSPNLGIPTGAGNGRTGLPSGAYSITITDNTTSCSISTSADVSNSNGPTVSVTGTTASTCLAADGTFTIDISTGTAPFNVTWTGPVNGNDVSNALGAFTATNLSPGSYSVNITDAVGCVTNTTVSIMAGPGALTGVAAVVTQPDCGGGTNGELSLTVSNGTGPYDYSINGGTPVNDAASSFNFTGLSSGNYQLCVTDANGCAVCENIQLDELGGPTVDLNDFNVTNITCPGAMDGSVTYVGPPNGIIYQLFQVGGASFPIPVTNLVAGDYFIQGTDGGGCIASSPVFTITEPSEFVITFSPIGESCSLNDGSVGVVVTGANGGYTYQWSTAEVTSSISNLTAGDYTLTVTDASGCVVIETVTVPYDCECSLSIDGTITINSSCGQSNGSITLVITDDGPILPYSYTWAHDATLNDSIATGLTAGNYFVTVTNATGSCVDQTLVAVTDVDGPSISAVVSTTPVCNATNGVVEVTINSGTANFVVTLTNGAGYNETQNVNAAGTYTFNNVPGGVYNASVTDANGCTSSVPVNVVPSSGNLAFTTTETQPSCGSLSDGAIQVNVTSGTLGFSFGINGSTPAPGASPFTFNGLGAGSYTIVVIDGAGCSTTQTVVLTEQGAPTINIADFTITDIDCPDADNGSIAETVVSGTVYTITPAGTTTPIGILPQNNLSEGLYTIETIVGGCTASDTFRINAPDAWDVDFFITNEGCTGVLGSIDLEVTGATPSYTYLWSTGATTQDITNIPGGTFYSVTITDANGCVIEEQNIFVDKFCPCDLNIDGTVVINSTCLRNDGEITVLVSGGTAPLNYNWNPSVPGATNVASNLFSGSYTLIVSDPTGCADTVTVEVIDADGPGVTVTNEVDATCSAADGGFTLNFNSGTEPFSYDYGTGANSANLGATVVTGLVSGTYTVNITDANGCVSAVTANVGAGSGSVTSVGTVVTQPDCGGGSNGVINLTLSGGTGPYDYTIDGSSASTGVVAATFDFTGLTAGTYEICGTDANGCESCATVLLSELGAPVIDMNDFQITDITCPGALEGEVTYIGSNPLPYILYNSLNGAVGPVPQTGLAAGEYHIEVTVGNCVAIGPPFTISGPADWDVVFNVTDESCALNDGSAEVIVSGANGGYTYLWSNSETGSSISNLTTGMYTVTITDASGCTVAETIMVDDACSCGLQIDGTVVINSTCGFNNGQIEILFSDTDPNPIVPYTFTWFPNVSSSNVASNLTAGLYNVTITNANGTCQDILTDIAVGDVNGPTATVVNVTDATCLASDGTVEISVTAGTAPFTVTWPGGGPVNLAALGNSTLTGFSAGTYPIQIQDDNGCQTVVTAIVNQSPGLLAISTSFVNPDCGLTNGSITVSVTGGVSPFDYSIDGMAPINSAAFTNLFSNLAGGIHEVCVTDANGCNVCEMVTLTENGAPVIDLSIFTITDVTCPDGGDGSIAFATPPGDGNVYQICQGTVVLGVLPQTGLPSGSYTIKTTQGGCTAVEPFTISAPVNWDVDIFPSLATCADDDGEIQLVVTGASSPFTFQWSGPGIAAGNETLQNQTGLSSDTYNVTITDINGCTVSETINLGIDCPCDISIASEVIVNTSCGQNNGQITLTVAGGNPPYTYTWSTPQGVNDQASSLFAGTYYITVEDSSPGSSCFVLDTFVVTNTDGPVVTHTTTPATCTAADGTVTINITTGVAPFDITWTGPSMGNQTGVALGMTTINGLLSGTYAFNIVDSQGCSTPQSVVVGQSSGTLVASGAVVTPADCGGGMNGEISITLTGGSGPYDYTLDGNSIATGEANATFNYTGLSAGTYQVCGTDANGCTSCDNVILSELGAPVIDLNDFTITDFSCPGASDGSISYNGTSGLTYEVYDQNNTYLGDVTVDTLSGGTQYYIQVTENGCTAQSPLFSITGPADWLVTFDVTPETCAGSDGTINVTATGGTGPYTYLWTGPGITGATQALEDQMGLAVGSYTLLITDQNGCTVTETVMVPNDCNCSLSIDGTVVTNSTCGYNNGQIEVLYSDGVDGSPYTFTWSSNVPGSPGAVVADLSAGSYDVTITNATGTCVAIENNIVVIDVNGPELGNVVVTDATCLAADGSIVFDILSGTAPFTLTLNGSALPQVNTVGTVTVDNLAADSYTILVTDANGCITSISEVVGATSGLLSIAVTNTVEPDCGLMNGEITVAVSGGTGTLNYTLNGMMLGGTTSPQTFTGLGAGMYTIEVTDQLGCVSSVMTNLSELGAPVIDLSDFTIVNVLCPDASNGSITYNGAGTLTYVIRDLTGSFLGAVSASSPVLSGLPEGSYQLETTLAGCTANTNFMISAPLDWDVDISPILSTCPDNDGELQLTVTGASNPYSFNWSGPGIVNASLEDQTGLMSGLYSVTITDANGCTVSETVNLGIDCPCDIEITGDVIINSSCNQNDGQITVLVAGGTGSYNYTWSANTNGGGIGNQAINLFSGTYFVTIEDAVALACSVVDTFIVTDSDGPTATLTGTTPATCDAADGSATIDISSGTPPFNVSWTGPVMGNMTGVTAGTQTYSNLLSGTYDWTIVDNTGCTTQIQVVVSEGSGSLAATGAVVTEPDCNGGANGEISIALAGGTGPFDYTLDGDSISFGEPGATFTFSNLTAGSYEVCGADANGCVACATVVLNELGGPTIDLNDFTITDILCPGERTGAIIYTGSSSLTYEVYTGVGSYQGDVPVDTLSAGTQYYILVFENGCSAQSPLFMIGGPSDWNVVFNVTDESCIGTDGAIGMTVAGATPGYTYSWTGPNSFVSSDQNISALVAGDYTVVITDMNSCTVSETVQVENGCDCSLSIDGTVVTNSTCNFDNGQIELIFSDGSVNPLTPYSFTWAGGGGAAAGSGAIASNLPAGVYSVTITNNNGSCVAIEENIVLVDVNGPSITNVVVTDANCTASDGSITFTVSSGMAPILIVVDGDTTQTLSMIGNVTIPNLSADNYAIQVIDAMGCETTISPVVGASSGNLQASATAMLPDCGVANGEITVSVSTGQNPLEYSINGGLFNVGSTSYTFTNLAAGIYDIVVRDGNGCLFPITYILNENGGPVIPLGDFATTDVTCPNGSDGTIQYNGTSTQVYVVRNSDNTFLGTISLGGTTMIGGLVAGDYTLEATLGNCSTQGIVTVGAPDDWDVDFFPVLSTCLDNDGEMSVVVTGATGPYTYNWTGPNSFGSSDQNLTGLASGVYNITITDALNCSVQETVVLGINCDCDMEVSSEVIVNSSCGQNDGSISITVNGGLMPYTYTWDPALPPLSTQVQLFSGTYYVTVTDATGTCSILDTLIVNDTDGPMVVLDTTTEATCTASDGSVTIEILSGNPGFDVSWPGGSLTGQSVGLVVIPGLAAGTYPVQVSDNLGCSTTISVTVTANGGGLVGTGSVVAEPDCGGGTNGEISITATGGVGPVYIYTIDGGNADTITGTTNNFTNLSAGSYTLCVTDTTTNCQDCDLVILNELGGPTIDLNDFTFTDVICPGDNNGSVVYNGSSSLTYEVYTEGSPIGTYLGDVPVDTLSGGVNYVIQATENGCTTISPPFSVSAPGDWLVIFDRTNESCVGNDGAVTATVSGANGGYTYQWSVSSGSTNTLTGLSAGPVTLTVTDALGCQVVETIQIGDDCNCDLEVQGIVAFEANCGGNDGSLEIIATSSNTPISYSWSHDTTVTGSIANGLSAGAYTITLTDAVCSTVVNVGLDNIDGPVGSVSVVDLPICSGAQGAVDITVASGVAPFIVTTSGIAMTSDTIIIPRTISLTGLSSGSLTVVIEDANGCITVLNEFLPQDNRDFEIATNIITEPDCNGGLNGVAQVNVVGTGSFPFSYTLDNVAQIGTGSSITISGISAGTHIFCATDANGCEDCDTLTINEVGAPTLDTMDFTVTNVSCPGGMDGGIAYSGSTPGIYYLVDPATGNDIGILPQVGILQSGCYTVRVESGNCSATVDLCVEGPEDWLLSIATSNVNCTPGEALIDITVSGATPGYTYLWSDGTTTEDRSNLFPGVYGVTITDANGCEFAEDITIVPCSTTEIHNVYADSLITICVDTSDLSSTLDTVLNACPTLLDDGTIVTLGQDGCIEYLAGGFIGVDTICVVNCDDLGICDTTTLIINILSPVDTVPVTLLTDASIVLCPDSANSIGIDTTDLPGNIVSVTNICPPTDGSIVIDPVTLCVTYTAGSYVGLDTLCLVICDDQFCDTTIVPITILSPIEIITDTIVNSNPPDFISVDTICLDVSALPGSGPYTVSDNFCQEADTNAIFNVIPGTVCVEIIGNAVGIDTACFSICDGMFCDTVNMIITVVPYTDTIYQIVQPNDTFTSCIDTTELPGTVISYTNLDCAPIMGELVSFDPLTGCFVYVGANDQFNDTLCIEVCDGMFCDTMVYVLGNLGVDPPIAVDDDANTIENTPVVIDVLDNDFLGGPFGVLDTIYILDPPGIGTATVTEDSEIVYLPETDSCGTDVFTYVICNQVGCDTATVIIEIECLPVLVYNGFSPNGDNSNETFFIQSIQKYPDNKVQIFNRWGNLVYSKEGYTNANGWDGTWNGYDVPDGTYFYMLQLNDDENSVFSGYLIIHR